MDDVIPCIIVVVFGVVILLARRNRASQREEQFLMFAFVLHGASALFLPWFFDNYMGGGDQVGYANHGRELAEGMRRDFFNFTPEVLRLFFQREQMFLDYDGTLGSTGSTSAITAFPMLILNGSSYAAGMVFTFCALSGKWCMYRVFRSEFPAEYRTRLLWAMLLVPSVVCWCSGLIKEGITCGPLGWAVFAIFLFNRGERLTPLLLGAVSCTVIAFIKPYVLLPLIAGGIVWIYWHRATTRIGGKVPVARPVYLIGAFVLAGAAVAAFGVIFPDYALDTFGEHSARAQDLGEQAGGGSMIEMGDSSERSLLGQLSFAPLALISSLFRPFIFEARNPLMAIAALETSVLTYLVARTIWQRSWQKTMRVIWESPLLMFSVIFTLLFGIAVGLTTVNLGTLSRYRMPLMPFYVALVLIVNKERTSAAPSALGERIPNEEDEDGDGGSVEVVREN